MWHQCQACKHKHKHTYAQSLTTSAYVYKANKKQKPYLCNTNNIAGTIIAMITLFSLYSATWGHVSFNFHFPNDSCFQVNSVCLHILVIYQSFSTRNNLDTFNWTFVFNQKILSDPQSCWFPSSAISWPWNYGELALSVTLWEWGQQASSWDAAVFLRKGLYTNQSHFSESLWPFLDIPEKIQHTVPNKCI